MEHNVVQGARATKLLPPAVAPPALPRPRLEGRLDDGLGRRLTVLIAGAGFGKSHPPQRLGRLARDRVVHGRRRGRGGRLARARARERASTPGARHSRSGCRERSRALEGRTATSASSEAPTPSPRSSAPGSPTGTRATLCSCSTTCTSSAPTGPRPGSSSRSCAHAPPTFHVVLGLARRAALRDRAPPRAGAGRRADRARAGVHHGRDATAARRRRSAGRRRRRLRSAGGEPRGGRRRSGSRWRRCGTFLAGERRA